MSESPDPCASEEDFQDLFDNAPCGYLSLDPAGRIVRLNRTLAGWLGIDAAETCGKPLYDLLPISGRMYFETHLKPLLRMQGFVNEVALELVKSDGARLPVIANGLERRDPSGRLLFTRVTLFLAAERRRYERNILAARDAAEAAGEQSRTQEIVTRGELVAERSTAELRDQFIAVLGHDLRNPLASIAGAGRLLRKEPLSSRGFSIIDMMEDSVSRMNGLIEDVLDFARGKLGGGLALATTEQDLEPVLQQVVSEFQTGTTDRVIQTEFALDRPMRFDRSRMGQMISNLLGNAITHGDRSQPIRIRATTIDDTLEITVANGGEPISDAALQRLFQPFFRGEIRPSQQGLGLGLYIASEIAKAHHGALTVTSSTEETRFTFRMPL